MKEGLFLLGLISALSFMDRWLEAARQAAISSTVLAKLTLGAPTTIRLNMSGAFCLKPQAQMTS